MQPQSNPPGGERRLGETPEGRKTLKVDEHDSCECCAAKMVG